MENNWYRWKFRCHEEADTKIVVHALREKTYVVVVAKDTDVLVLMVYTYALKDIKEDWYNENWREKVCECAKNSPTSRKRDFSKVTSHPCDDTTSYLHSVGKMKVLDKCLKCNEVVNCLEGLGKNASFTPENFEDVIKFIQTINLLFWKAIRITSRWTCSIIQKTKDQGFSITSCGSRLHEASDSTHSSPTPLLAAVGCKSGQFNSLWR